MHDTALKYGKLFFENYLLKKSKILDVGSLNINGSLKSLINKEHEYIGIDMSAGKDVDIVQDDPYKLPFEDNFYDIVLATSVFEHSELFWLLSNEIFRVLKPDGLFYMNAPSNGSVHRFPVDCWRFYPDAGNAIVNWGIYSGYKNLISLESFIGKRNKDIWNDYCCIFLKDKNFIKNYPNRIVDKDNNFNYGKVTGSGNEMINNKNWVEDARLTGVIKIFIFRLRSFVKIKHWFFIFLKKVKLFNISKEIYKKLFK